MISRIKIDKRTNCWDWTGYITPAGYGRLGAKLAHRIMYERKIGAIPKGLELDHLCRNTKCVNPQHLEPVTAAENSARRAVLTTHCPAGHEYSYMYMDNKGHKHRKCRECSLIRYRLNKGWDIDKAAKTPTRIYRRQYV